MIRNLLHTGTVFDYKADDQAFIDDMLNADLDEYVKESPEPSEDQTFEDED